MQNQEPRDLLRLTVADVACEACDILRIELRARDNRVLPGFEAGAHVEIRLPGGMVRHYSLLNDPAERDRYCIAVARVSDGRGGSALIHQQLRVGMEVLVSAPRNNFPLDGSDAPCVFIAGGIGITPFLSMIRTCVRIGRPWQLHYGTRNRLRAAFYEVLTAEFPRQCHLHFDDEAGGAPLEVASLIEAVPVHSHLYCCGPTPMMEAVKHATADWPAEQIHFEWFSSPELPNRAESAFDVIIASTGARYPVPPGKSILEVLEAHGALVPAACREGLCATCRTRVLEGVPEHRDCVLTQAEREANDQMLICVSRALSDKIVLDL
ncbi:oxidoreductase [Nitrogeniibacter mangrovi]|uniref:Oxidoreductase n=1 Tax=Nitrogeniibacter mangrovi TaxID=2016596 RepID=A0A6C1B257_9RHOO|nr:PDR/VanB family oxidoreductase [Nitrogeniibacter mangrovi]QID17647.1 oxidoreductase [Nitrogeniibacter mangrovi]